MKRKQQFLLTCDARSKCWDINLDVEKITNPTTKLLKFGHHFLIVLMNSGIKKYKEKQILLHRTSKSISWKNSWFSARYILSLSDFICNAYVHAVPETYTCICYLIYMHIIWLFQIRHWDNTYLLLWASPPLGWAKSS